MNNAWKIVSKGSTLLRGCWFWSKKLHFQKNFGRNFIAVEGVRKQKKKERKKELSWNFADFRRVKISWIPGTYTLLIINNLTETFCNVDDWIFHSLSLCLSQFSVYYLCRFVTVCTVKKMWTGGYVTVIFHILSIRKHVFKTDYNTQKKDRKISQTPSPTR